MPNVVPVAIVTAAPSATGTFRFGARRVVAHDAQPWREPQWFRKMDPGPHLARTPSSRGWVSKLFWRCKQGPNMQRVDSGVDNRQKNTLAHRNHLRILTVYTLGKGDLVATNAIGVFVVKTLAKAIGGALDLHRFARVCKRELTRCTSRSGSIS